MPLNRRVSSPTLLGRGFWVSKSDLEATIGLKSNYWPRQKDCICIALSGEVGEPSMVHTSNRGTAID